MTNPLLIGRARASRLNTVNNDDAWTVTVNNTDRLRVDTAGNVMVTGNLDVTGVLTGDGSGLTGITIPPTISTVTITDALFNAIDDTALDTVTGGYLKIEGSNFDAGTIVSVGGTNASSTSFVSESLLHVQAPPKGSGTYTLTVTTGAGLTTSGTVTYSAAPTWTTASTALGTTVDNYPFSFEAANTVTYDSAVTLSTTTLPTGLTVALVGNVVTVAGKIANVVSDTAYSFDVSLTDAQLQDTNKSFTVQHAATYGSSHLGNVILDVLQESANSSTIVPTVESPPNLASATGSGNGPYTLNGYEITASSVYDDNSSLVLPPILAFNKTNSQANDCWHTAIGSSTPQWIQLKLPSSQLFISYSITSRFTPTSNWYPRTWQMQGSTNGSSWTTLDSRTDDSSLSTEDTTVNFTISSPGSYTYYRLYVTSVNSASSYLTIAQLRFFTGDYTVTPGGTYPGNNAYYGGVLLPDGRVFCVPVNATTASVYNPTTDSVSTYGTFSGGSSGGGVLLRDGRVFCSPLGATAIRLFNPSNNTVEVSSVTVASNDFFGSVRLLDGRVFMVPFGSTTARIYDPVSDTATTPNGTYPGSSAFLGGVLMRDGRVFCVPYTSTTARIYDPVTDTLTTPNGSYPGGSAFYGGVLLPDGRVYCVPGLSTTARIYDPVTNTTTTPSGTYPGGNKYLGGVLLPDGRVFCVPNNATTASLYDPATDTVTTQGAFPGGNAFLGGVLMKDGRVFCVPRSSTTARIFVPTSTVTEPFTQSDAIVLSPFLNKL